MHAKLFTTAALASVAAAQTKNLTTTLASDPNLSMLTQYLGFYPAFVQSVSNLTNITLLAPSNEAFTKLLNSSAGSAVQANDTSLIDALFSYHILDGKYLSSNFTSTAQFIPTKLVDPTYSDLTAGQVVEAVANNGSVAFFSGLFTDSTVTQANMNFTGGVVHVVDTFLTIPQNISTTLDVLNLTSALGAIEASGVAAGGLPANLTAFIPNNAAFQAIGSALGNVSMQQLAAIVGYHIVPDVVAYSADIKSGMNLTTATNGTLHITESNGSIFVNSAKVIVPNVLCMEGVVHVIENVLNPQDSTAKPNATASTQSVAFSGASSASVVPFTSGIPAPTSAIATPSAATATGAVGAGSGSGSGSSSSSKGVAMPMKTGAVGAAALFGGAVAIMNM